EPVAEAAGKKTARKTAAKKAPAKNAAEEKSAEAKTTIILEYCGRQVTETTMIAGAKKVWADAGRTEAIETMELYVNPEDGAEYCGLNGGPVGTFCYSSPDRGESGAAFRAPGFPFFRFRPLPGRVRCYASPWFFSACFSLLCVTGVMLRNDAMYLWLI